MDEYKDDVWMYFEEHVVPVIQKYQVELESVEVEETDGLTTAKFEKYLVQAISEEHRSKVQMQ